METTRHDDQAGTDILMEKIRVLELREIISTFKRNELKKKVDELDATLRLKTGELAVLSELLNAHHAGKTGRARQGRNAPSPD